MIKKELDKKNLSINIRTKVFRLFEHIPIIPTNQLFQYAVMLHYCVTGRRRQKCFRVLCNYLHLLERWEKEYAPQTPDEAWNPLFVEALQKKPVHGNICWDILLVPGSMEGTCFRGSLSMERGEED